MSNFGLETKIFPDNKVFWVWAYKFPDQGSIVPNYVMLTFNSIVPYPRKPLPRLAMR